MRHVISEGIVLDDDYGYAGVTGQDCTPLENKTTPLFPLKDVVYIQPWNATAMAGAVAEHGSVVAAIKLSSDLLTYSDGIYDNPLCCTGAQKSAGTCLDHAVTIVGYGDDPSPYWIVRNSWSPVWGDRGYMKMAKGTDTCGIEANPVLPVAA